MATLNPKQLPEIGNASKREMAHYTIAGGSSNTITASTYSAYNNFIGGSTGNKILSSCASIVGGFQNSVSGNYSAILGGSGNTISAAYQYAGIFGCNIAAVASNAFHTNCLIACDTPLYISGPGYVSGTIFKSAGPLPFGALALYIMP